MDRLKDLLDIGRWKTQSMIPSALYSVIHLNPSKKVNPFIPSTLHYTTTTIYSNVVPYKIGPVVFYVW